MLRLIQKLGHERRHIIAWVALVLATIFLVLGVFGIYVNRNIFDSNRFADRATATLHNGDVRQLVSRKLTNQLAKSVPDSIAVQPIIESVANVIVGSGPFQALFRRGVYDFHGSLLHRDRTSVTLAVADAGVLVADALNKLQPGLANKIPKGLRTQLVSLSNGIGPTAFVNLGRAARDVRVLTWILLFLAIVFFILAAYIAPNHRIALKRVGVAIVAAGLSLAFLVELGRFIIGLQFPTDDRAAVREIWDAFVADARTWGLALSAIGAVLTGVAASWIRPEELDSQALRIWGFMRVAPKAAGWRAVRALVLVGIGLLAVIDWRALVQAAAFVGGLYLLYIGVRELIRIALALDINLEAIEEDVEHVLGRWRRSPALRTLLVAGIALLGIGAVVAVAVTTQTASTSVGEIRECNGYAALCDRQISQVVFPSTHNSMSAGQQPGWLFPNQNDPIPNQLNAGIRGLLIDTHYGVRTPRGVATVLAQGSKSRTKFVAELGEGFVIAAERLRRHIGYRGGGKKEVFFCHGYCELGATPGITVLQQIRDFLIRNPYEVLIVSIEDDVTPADTAKLFNDSGLLDFVYTGPLTAGHFPTLRDLIERNERVVVFGENNTRGVPWYHPQFQFVQETPYDFNKVKQVDAPESCRPNRGGTKPPLFLLNNWLEVIPPRPSAAAKVNAYPVLLKRARECQGVRHRLVNLLAVDFYRQGDVLGVANTLNGVGKLS